MDESSPFKLVKYYADLLEMPMMAWEEPGGGVGFMPDLIQHAINKIKREPGGGEFVMPENFFRQDGMTRIACEPGAPTDCSQDPDDMGSGDNEDDGTDQLCAKHRDIDIPKVLSSKPLSGFHVMSLGALRDTLWREHCPFCRLLTHIINNSVKNGVNPHLLQEKSINSCFFELFIRKDFYSFENDYSPSLEPENDRWTAEFHLYSKKDWEEIDHLIPTESRASIFALPLRLVPVDSKSSSWHQVNKVKTRIELNLVKGWLHDCYKQHGALCLPRLWDSKKNRSEFRIVDVDLRSVVAAPIGCKYFALSYVWGSPENQKFMSLKENSRDHYGRLKDLELPDTLSTTIEDAMYLTRRLDMRYLWVDVLCIVQDDESHKSGQISQMGDIYSCSSLTIIAAGGCNANSPLPGLCTPRAAFQTIEKVGKSALTNVLPRSKEAINASTWNQRAWTFQERLLSKRCLIFTKYQVYFQCLQTACCEDTVPDDFGSKPNGIIRNSNFQGIESLLCPSDRANFFQVYAKMVISYTKRQISVSKDIIRAFEGALTGLGSKYDVHFVHGIPNLRLDLALLWDPVGPIDVRRGTVSESNSNTKLTAEEPLQSIRNKLSNPQQGHNNGTISGDEESQRRLDWPDYAMLPSWTWAAWEGHIMYNRRLFNMSESKRKLLWFEEVQEKNLFVHKGAEVGPDYYVIPETCSELKPDPIVPGPVLKFWTTSAYFHAGCREPNGDDINAYTARVRMLSVPAHLHSISILDDHGKEAGEMLLSEGWSVYENERCEFIVISQVKDVDRMRWHGGWGGDASEKYSVTSLDSPTYQTEPAETKEWSYFKVMLIKRKNELTYRIGIGTIHTDAWKSANPTWWELGKTLKWSHFYRESLAQFDEYELAGYTTRRQSRSSREQEQALSSNYTDLYVKGWSGLGRRTSAGPAMFWKQSGLLLSTSEHLPPPNPVT